MCYLGSFIATPQREKSYDCYSIIRGKVKKRKKRSRSTGEKTNKRSADLLQCVTSSLILLRLRKSSIDLQFRIDLFQSINPFALLSQRFLGRLQLYGESVSLWSHRFRGRQICCCVHGGSGWGILLLPFGAFDLSLQPLICGDQLKKSRERLHWHFRNG